MGSAVAARFSQHLRAAPMASVVSSATCTTRRRKMGLGSESGRLTAILIVNSAAVEMAASVSAFQNVMCMATAVLPGCAMREGGTKEAATDMHPIHMVHTTVHHTSMADRHLAMAMVMEDRLLDLLVILMSTSTVHHVVHRMLHHMLHRMVHHMAHCHHITTRMTIGASARHLAMGNGRLTLAKHHHQEPTGMITIVHGLVLTLAESQS
mmetsp:Transcript_141658/g.250306  ORF Transcript_141658/g.250306 Transcript_141658/m.250306 type:complete len:209 (-) Transcript_141658:32-658(-)